MTASLFTCAQIILTELFLGLIARLYLSFLVIVNISIAILVPALGRRFSRVGETKTAKDDFFIAKSAVRAALDGPAVVLLTVALLTYGWIAAAAYFLPPRGLDDLVYHLPAIFEYVRSHEIRLVRDVFWHFAFPENGELLFLWPAIFTHEQRWLDGMNVPFVFMSVMMIYALFRHFHIREKDAFFAALLYALCPAVLMLAGVNYIDIIVSLFLLLSLYYSIRYHERGQRLDLFAAGLSMGLMCGTKYTGLLLAIPLQALILPTLLKGRWRNKIGYVSVFAVACGWWYIRNAVVLGDVVYPTHEVLSMPRAIRGWQGGSIMENILYNLPYWIVRYPLYDLGVGTYSGGFGLVFWGMGFPSWLLMTVQSLIAINKTKFSTFIMLLYVPVGFLILLMLPPQWVHANGRFSVFVVVVGLFAFCEVLRMMQDEGFISIIKGICVVLSLVTISLMSLSDQPSYRLGEAVSDAINHKRPSEFKYLADSIDEHAMLRRAWEVLDLLTRNDRIGMNCFIASDPHLYATAPVYGSKLQNRVLNMNDSVQAPVDAFICTYMDKDKLDYPCTIYDEGHRRELPIRDILAKKGYLAVIQTDHAALMLREDIFERPDKQKILQAYYGDTWPEAVAVAEKMTQELDAKIPVITSSEIGYGVRSLDMKRAQPNRVYLSFENREQEVATRINAKQCYTLDKPLSGYRFRKITEVSYRRKLVDVYLNWRS